MTLVPIWPTSAALAKVLLHKIRSGGPQALTTVSSNGPMRMRGLYEKDSGSYSPSSDVSVPGLSQCPIGMLGERGLGQISE